MFHYLIDLVHLRSHRAQKITTLLVFLIIVFYSYYAWTIHNDNKLSSILQDNTGFWRTRDIPCIDFVLQGKLYQGQLACAQGPITYLTGGLLALLLGKNVFMYGFITALTFLAFFIFIISFRTANHSLLTIPFFFILLPLFYSDFSSTLSTFFVLFSLFLLYSHTTIPRSFFAGSLASLSFFTKTTPLVIFAIFFPLALFRLYHSQSQVESKNIIKNIASFSIGLFIATAIILSFYPNVFIYSFLSHVSENPSTPFHILKSFMVSILSISSGLHLFFLCIVTILFWIVTTKNSQTLPILTLMTTLVPANLLLQSVDSGGKGMGFLFFDHHLLPYLLLFIIAGILLIELTRSRTILVLMLILLIWAFMFKPVLENPTTIAPTTQKSIFVDFLNTLDYSHAFVDATVASMISKPIFKINYYTSVKHSTMWGIADANYGIWLKKHGYYDETNNQPVVEADKRKYAFVHANVSQELARAAFDFIALGPADASPVLSALKFAEQNKTLARPYCTVHVPIYDVYHGEFWVAPFLFFSNESCQNTKKDMKTFFLSKLPTLCAHPPVLNALIYLFTKYNNLTMPSERQLCTTPQPPSLPVDTKNILPFALLFSMVFILSLITSLKAYKTGKRKQCYSLAIIALTALLTMLYLLFVFVYF